MTFTLLNFLLLPICRIFYPICQNKLMCHTPPKILFWEFLIWSTDFWNLEYIFIIKALSTIWGFHKRLNDLKKVQSESQNTSVNSKKIPESKCWTEKWQYFFYFLHLSQCNVPTLRNNDSNIRWAFSKCCVILEMGIYMQDTYILLFKN